MNFDHFHFPINKFFWERNSGFSVQSAGIGIHLLVFTENEKMLEFNVIHLGIYTIRGDRNDMSLIINLILSKKSIYATSGGKVMHLHFLACFVSLLFRPRCVISNNFRHLVLAAPLCPQSVSSCAPERALRLASVVGIWRRLSASIIDIISHPRCQATRTNGLFFAPRGRSVLTHADARALVLVCANRIFDFDRDASALRANRSEKKCAVS